MPASRARESLTAALLLSGWVATAAATCAGAAGAAVRSTRLPGGSGGKAGSALTAATPPARGTRAAPGARQEADTTAVLVGRVLLADIGAPARAARVELTGRDRTALTDSLGRFRLQRLEPGPDTLRVTTLEGRSESRAVDLEAGVETEVQVTLEPRVVDVGGIEVTVEGPRRTELRRLADRIDRGVGEYITREKLEDREGRLSFAFRGLIGVDVEYVPGGDFRVLMRRRLGRGYCSPQLFVDGSPQPGVPVDAYDPKEVAAVEVYTADVVPGEYRTTATMECGAVLIWTQRFLR